VLGVEPGLRAPLANRNQPPTAANRRQPPGRRGAAAVRRPRRPGPRPHRAPRQHQHGGGPRRAHAHRQGDKPLPTKVPGAAAGGGRRRGGGGRRRAAAAGAAEGGGVRDAHPVGVWGRAGRGRQPRAGRRRRRRRGRRGGGRGRGRELPGCVRGFPGRGGWAVVLWGVFLRGCGAGLITAASLSHLPPWRLPHRTAKDSIFTQPPPAQVRSLAKSKAPPSDILAACDAVRDGACVDLGVRLEDRPDGGWARARWSDCLTAVG
jgi:hypothetical protein